MKKGVDKDKHSKNNFEPIYQWQVMVNSDKTHDKLCWPKEKKKFILVCGGVYVLCLALEMKTKLTQRKI